MFCIFWILCGIILISLFTGLVTAALHLSATPVFNLPGAKVRTLFFITLLSETLESDYMADIQNSICFQSLSNDTQCTQDFFNLKKDTPFTLICPFIEFLHIENIPQLKYRVFQKKRNRFEKF